MSIPDANELRDCYALVMDERSGQDYDEAKVDAERGLAVIRGEARDALINELMADAELDITIGRQGDDAERVRTAERIITVLSNARIEEDND